MKFRKPIIGALTLCALSAFCASAHADVTVVSRTTMDSPFMHMGGAGQSPQMQAMMDKLSKSTTYISGNKMRRDAAMITMIADGDSKQMWLVNTAAHTYSASPYNQTQIKQMMSGNVAGAAPGVSNIKVSDTGKTTKVLGHLVRHYVVSMTTNVHGQSTTIHEDILAAPDLTQRNTALMGIPPQVHGLPLVTSMKMTGGMAGGMTMKLVATSISTQPIPASIFKIPAGYTKTTPQAMQGGMMGMMGHP